jgi:hypothetical protein
VRTAKTTNRTIARATIPATFTQRGVPVPDGTGSVILFPFTVYEDVTLNRVEHEHAEHGQVGHAHHAEASLNWLAASATNHCLTGCLIGEVTGMTIATALGWGDVASIALAVGLAFLFGYTLTSIPLIRANLALAAIVPIALAADTVSIAIMEFIDNLFMILVPGAMEAGLSDARFWLPLLGGFAIAWPFAFAVNRAMIRRGKGHAVVHEYH